MRWLWASYVASVRECPGVVLLAPHAGKDATSQNLFYNAAGQPVYFVAGVGVVYTPRGSGASTGSQATPASTSVVGPGGHSQHFFLGHTDDIKAMAVCNAEVDVNGRKYPAKTVVATAQVGVGPNVWQRMRHWEPLAKWWRPSSAYTTKRSHVAFLLRSSTQPASQSAPRRHVGIIGRRLSPQPLAL